MSSKQSNRARASVQKTAARSVPAGRNRDDNRLNRGARSRGGGSRNRLVDVEACPDDTSLLLPAALSGDELAGFHGEVMVAVDG